MSDDLHSQPADAETAALARAIRDGKISRAAPLPPGEKLIAGARLFDQVRARALCGIRARHPEWTEIEVENEFRRQLALRRDRAERGIYRSLAAGNAAPRGTDTAT
jgi:hypothetical protein